MKYVSFFSGIFLIAVVFFTWGFGAGKFNIFPEPLFKGTLDDIAAFIAGGQSQEKTIREKLMNDAGLRPERALVDLHKRDERKYAPLSVAGLKSRRSSPLVFDSGKAAIPPGYLLIWGAFDFASHLHGGILLDHKGRVRHRWMPDEGAIVSTVAAYNKEIADKRDRVTYLPPKVRFPHGLVVFPDGAILFNDGDAGNGMQKIDFCSKNLWVKLGEFTHAITQAEENASTSIWTIDQHYFHKIDAATGHTLGIINAYDIIRANAELDILSIRRDCITGEWLWDPWHFNDIEALPEGFESAYPGFKPGDLMLSLRSLNALMVIDPNTLRIKWWRLGAYSRQHDPDWQKNGWITVYDNQPRYVHDAPDPRDGSDFSRIIRLNVATFDTEVLYEGRNDGFYSKIRGKHQMLPNGNILITSPMQGRVLVVSPAGETVFELLNCYDEKDALLVSEAVWLPKDFFNFAIDQKKCKAQSGDTVSAERHRPSSDHYAASRFELKSALQRLTPVPLESQLPYFNGPFLAFDGWSLPEPSFVWSQGTSASIYFRLPVQFAGQGGKIALLCHTLGHQRIHVYFNGQAIRSVDADLTQAEWLAFDLPADAVRQNAINRLRLAFPDARRPGSADSRFLAAALHGVEFTAARQQ